MPQKHILTIPLLVLIHVFMGISTAGVNLAGGLFQMVNFSFSIIRELKGL
jgi:hypothetical protein